jgi:LPXTG-motif cell wall-anchored protein
MKQQGYLWSIAVVAALCAIAGIAPAHAASYVPGDDVFVGPNNNKWVFRDMDAASVRARVDDDYTRPMWDIIQARLTSDGGVPFTDAQCSAPADLTADGADQVLTCDAQTIDTWDGLLSLVTEFRFFAAGDTVRMRYTITNTDDATVAGQIFSIAFDTSQDDNTIVSYTDTDGLMGDYAVDYGTGTTVVTDADNYVWVTDDRVGGTSTTTYVAKYAVGQAGSISPLVDIDENTWTSGGHGNGGNLAQLYYRVPDLAPGETVEYVALAKVYFVDASVSNDPVMSGWQEGTGIAIADAASDTELESDAFVFAGISDRTRVVNWEPAPSTANENLANTGADSGAPGLLAIGLVASLIALAVRRRSRA